MSTAYSRTDVVSTPLVLLDRELKKSYYWGYTWRNPTRKSMRENKHIHVVENKLETISSTNLGVHTNLTILIGRCWMLILFSVSLIKVEILLIHIKLICKLLERIGGSILYVQERNEHWIPFIYDLWMLWSPVQNFESALGITHAPTRSLSISSRGPEIDWKRTRVGTIRSFHLWTYNILPLIPTDPPPPRVISIIEIDQTFISLHNTQLISEHQSISSTCVEAWTE